MADPKQDDGDRFRTEYHGYTIHEINPEGGSKIIFREGGCTWDNAPERVHLMLQSKEAKMRDELRAMQEARVAEKDGKRKQ